MEIASAVASSIQLTASPANCRPYPTDPDALYIDCALAGGASVILSRDRHFRHPAVAAFGLRVLSAGEYLSEQRSAALNHRRP
jgi:hypothetical protein